MSVQCVIVTVTPPLEVAKPGIGARTLLGMTLLGLGAFGTVIMVTREKQPKPGEYREFPTTPR